MCFFPFRKRRTVFLLELSFALCLLPTLFAWGGPQNWTGTGPQGGSIHSLVFDPVSPNILYASLSRGVYKSVDSAGSWSAQGLAGQETRSLTVDPVDNNIIYAPQYRGISKSLDGGRNWSFFPSTYRFLGFAIDPAHPATIYAGLECGNGYEGCVAKSADGGSTWTRLSQGAPQVSILALAIDPHNSQLIYAGGFHTNWSPSFSRDDGVYKTTDGGASWTKVGLEYLSITSLAMDPGNPNTLYACDSQGIYKTTDGGKSWNSLNAGFKNENVTSMVMSPTAPHILWVGTSAGLYKTSDGGNSWIPVSGSWFNPFVTAVAVHPANPSIICAGTAGNGFQLSRDGGNTWTLQNHGLNGAQIWGMAADPHNANLLYAATWGAGIHKSTDRGGSWASMNRGLTSPNVYFIRVDPVDPSVLFTATKKGVFKSTDGGGQWIASNQGLPGERTWDLVIDPTDHNLVYGAFDVSSNTQQQSSGLFKSTDGGANWTAIDYFDDSVSSLLFFPGEPKTLWASSRRGIFKSQDAGGTWTPISNAAIASTSASELLFSPQAPNTVFAQATVEGVGGIYRSTDGGRHWKNVFSTGSIVYCMAISPTDPHVVYLGSSGGIVYKSSNGGNTWMALPANAVPGASYSLAVDRQDPHTIYAGTDSFGVQALTLMPGALPMIEVTSPNQGERWKTDTTQTITWTSSGINGPVKIEYSTDGNGYISIVDSTENTGSYAWVIPSASFTLCQVRISTLDGTTSDSSDVWFSTFQKEDTPPSVTFSQPANNSLISGTVLVLAAASDDEGIQRVEIFVDGRMVFDRNIPEYGFPWDTTAYPNGSHTLLVRAYDTMGQTADDWITVLVNNSSGGANITWILPSSAHVAGAGNTFWSTDLMVANAGTSAASVVVKFLGNNSDGRQGPERTISLAPGQSVTSPDVLLSLFGISSGFGAIRLASSTSDIKVLSQTSTPGAGGTYGQSVPAQDASQWITPIASRTIDAIREISTFRTNLILVNASEVPVQADIALNAEWYETLAVKSYNLPPLGMIQINRVVRDLGISQDITGARMTLSTSTPGGAFAAYATAIDNVTGDPRTLLPQGAASWLLPSSARISGAGGTFWTTNLTISNPSSQEARFALRFLGNRPDAPPLPEEPYKLAGGTSTTFRDVLSSVFGLSSDYGSIQLKSNVSELTMVAETSTPGGGGSFGQSVPAAAGINLVRIDSEKSILGITENSKFRANLILANATGQPIEAVATLIAENGMVLGSKPYALAAFGMTQVNHIARDLGVNGDISGARLILSTASPKGTFAAYVALIDNGTGDPRTLLPQ